MLYVKKTLTFLKLKKNIWQIEINGAILHYQTNKQKHGQAIKTRCNNNICIVDYINSNYSFYLSTIIINNQKTKKMKKTFIMFMYNSEAVEATGGEQTNVSNEKTKLELLQEAGLAIWEKLKTVDFGSKEANDLQLDLFKNKNEIATEQKRLENEKREQEAKLLREQKLQELRNLCTLAVENDKIANDKKSSEEAKNAAKMALDEQFEKIANIVLGGKTEKPATSSNGETVKRGGTAEAIIAEYEKHVANGCTDTEARKKTIEAGFSRGTTGAVVKAYLDAKA